MYAVPNMAAFCISLISCFPSTLLRYCLSDFEMVPVAPIITAITFACIIIIIIIIMSSGMINVIYIAGIWECSQLHSPPVLPPSIWRWHDGYNEVKMQNCQYKILEFTFGKLS